MTMYSYRSLAARRQKRGFTLTEIAIVLGIIGLILGAIWVAAAAVYNNQRINQGNTAVLQVLQAVRTLYAQNPVMATGDQTNNLVQAGVIPTNLVKGTASPYTMQTPWSGTMYVGGDTTSGYFDIELSGMSTALCTGLIMQLFGASHDRTLDTASTVSNANLTAFSALTANSSEFNATVPPIPNGAGTPSASGTGCTVQSTTNSVKLAFGLQG